MIRTLLNFPIASVQAARAGGRVGMSLCPGRPLNSPLERIHSQLLGHDLGTIARWGANAIVTLMENEELLELGVQDLGERVRGLGMAWYFLPLSKTGVPGANFDRRWAALSPQIEAALGRKGKVLIHCRDGVSRTGFVAARVLVDLGCRPEDAINRVRGARPGAIESPEQQRHILSMRAPATGQLVQVATDRMRPAGMKLPATIPTLWAVVTPPRPKPAFTAPKALFQRGSDLSESRVRSLREP